MSETNAPEPTMEEILASIRRIISEDDGAAPATAAHEPEDHVLELTEQVDPPAPPPEPTRSEPPRPEPPRLEPSARPAQPVGDFDVFTRPAARPEPTRYEPPRPDPTRAAPSRPMFEPSFSASSGEEGLVSPHAAEAAASHFGQLAQSIAMPAPTVTLDDVVRELLKPLLRDWLDQHLGGIVQSTVQAEVERIARQRR